MYLVYHVNFYNKNNRRLQEKEVFKKIILQTEKKVVLLRRKAARVVDWDSLEICCTREGTGGSNPSLSALNKANSKVFKIFLEDLFL